MFCLHIVFPMTQLWWGNVIFLTVLCDRYTASGLETITALKGRMKSPEGWLQAHTDPLADPRGGPEGLGPPMVMSGYRKISSKACCGYNNKTLILMPLPSQKILISGSPRLFSWIHTCTDPKTYEGTFGVICRDAAKWLWRGLMHHHALYNFHQTGTLVHPSNMRHTMDRTHIMFL